MYINNGVKVCELTIITGVCSSCQVILVCCFDFTAHNFTVLLHCHCSHQSRFQPQQEDVFIKKALIIPLYASYPAQIQIFKNWSLNNFGRDLARGYG